MDLLKIENNAAVICLNGEKKNVSQVTTDDINEAIKLLMEPKDIQIAIDEDTATIANPAQRIIFEQLRSSFKEVLESRDSILAEIVEVFAEAEAKYLKTDTALDAEECVPE